MAPQTLPLHPPLTRECSAETNSFEEEIFCIALCLNTSGLTHRAATADQCLYKYFIRKHIQLLLLFTLFKQEKNSHSKELEAPYITTQLARKTAQIYNESIKRIYRGVTWTFVSPASPINLARPACTSIHHDAHSHVSGCDKIEDPLPTKYTHRENAIHLSQKRDMSQHYHKKNRKSKRPKY